MKPLGTITKYYSFLDSDTRETLDAIMEESSNYYDFVLRLGRQVLERDVSNSLAYLAAVHAWWARAIEITKALNQKYEHLPQLKPWTFLVYTAESSQALQYDDFRAALDIALEAVTEDWIITELHILHSLFHWPYLYDAPSQLKPLDEAKRLISRNPKLQFFSPLVSFLEAEARLKAGDSEVQVATYDEGYNLAAKSSDSVLEYMFLLEEAHRRRNMNIMDGVNMYEELYSFTQELGVPYFQAQVTRAMGVAFELAGEYDLAITSQLEALDIIGSDISPSGCDTDFMILSRIYASLGNGAMALDYANRAFEYLGDVAFPTPYFRKARALALLNRLDEAETHLIAAHSRILKMGQEFRFIEYYYIAGEIELRRGNLSTAQDYFEQALDIAERIQDRLRISWILLGFARLELAQNRESKEAVEPVAPGKWLSRLEKHVKSQDKPGIAIQTALIKADLYQDYGQLRNARETLQQALGVSDSLGVKTLRASVSNRIRELNRLLVESELNPDSM